MGDSVKAAAEWKPWSLPPDPLEAWYPVDPPPPVTRVELTTTEWIEFWQYHNWPMLQWPRSWRAHMRLGQLAWLVAEDYQRSGGSHGMR